MLQLLKQKKGVKSNSLTEIVYSQQPVERLPAIKGEIISKKTPK